MRFGDIANYEDSKNKLISSHRNNRVGHSMLFLGEEGCPALAMAIAFAQYLSCENREAGDSCGICRSCAKFEKLAHPDLHFYYPTATSKKVPKKALSQHYAEEWRNFLKDSMHVSLSRWLAYMDTDKKDAIIPTEDSLMVIRDLSLKSFESPYRFAIIWLPERMNVHSSNRLLKIIEEPPDNVFFFLVSQNEENVLPTIVSRTQIVRIGRMKIEAMREWLKSTYPERSESERAFAVKYSQGNALKALEAMDLENDHTAQAQQFIEWARLCYALPRKLPEILHWSEDMSSKKRSEQRSFLNYGLDFLRAGLLNQNMASGLINAFPEEEDHIRNFSGLLNLDNSALLLEEFNDALSNLGRNANAKILFMHLSNRFGKLINPKNVNL